MILISKTYSEVTPESAENGDRPNTMEYFGHYCAMQAMGHGVGLSAAFSADVHSAVKVPHIEFSACSLEKDYTDGECEK